MGEHQNFKLRKLKAAIDRIALLVNSNAAMKKMQKKEKAMEKQLSRLRQLEEIEVPERNKVVRSVMAILKKEQKQTSKQMISLGRRLGRHVHLDHAALRKEEKIVTSKEVTAVKQLHAALRKLMNTLLRRRMAQFKEELSRVKVKNEQRVEHQDFKLRKLKAAIDRIALHVNSNSAMKKMLTSKELTAAKKLHAAFRKLMNRLSRHAEGERRMRQQDSKFRKLKVAIDRIGMHANSNPAEKELQKGDKAAVVGWLRNQEGKFRWVGAVAGWLRNPWESAIGRSGLHVNSNAANKKLQREEKAMKKRLTHLRPAKEIEDHERSKWSRSAMP